MKVANGARAVEVAEIRDNGTAAFSDTAPTESGNVYVLVGKKAEIKAPTVEQKTVTLRVVYETGAVRDVIPIAVEKKDGAYAGTYKLDLNGFTASCDAEMATIDETGLVSFSFQDDEPVTIVVTLRGEKATTRSTTTSEAPTRARRRCGIRAAGGASSALRRRPWPIPMRATRARASRRRS